MVRSATLKWSEHLNSSSCDNPPTGTDPLDTLHHSCYITFVPETTTMLTGPALVSKVSELQAQNVSTSEIVRQCGYIKENGNLSYVDFYTELLTEKGLINQEEDPKIAEEHREEYDRLCANYAEDAVKAFIELYGEDNLEYFEEAYHGYYDSEEDFAEQYSNDVYGVDVPSFLVIDWAATWNCSLRYDFDYENGYVFNKNF